MRTDRSSECWLSCLVVQLLWINRSLKWVMWAAFAAQIQWSDHLNQHFLVQSHQNVTVSISYQLRCDKINPEFQGKFEGEQKLSINTTARFKHFRAFAEHKNGICWKSGLPCLIVGVWSRLTRSDGPSSQNLASQLIHLHNVPSHSPAPTAGCVSAGVLLCCSQLCWNSHYNTSGSTHAPFSHVLHSHGPLELITLGTGVSLQSPLSCIQTSYVPN